MTKNAKKKKPVTRLNPFTGKARSAVFIVAFAVLGTLIIIATRAAGPYISSEAEIGQQSGKIAVKGDSEASGGQYVEFGVDPPPTDSASQVSRNGVTFYFDGSYPVGQFANGDWWVRGPVTITRITPDEAQVGSGTSMTSGVFHGWMVNPSPCDNYPNCGYTFDSRMPVYNSSLKQSLPYTANGDQSIAKAISASDCSEWASIRRVCLDRMTILTVLDSIPSVGSETLFRPPYSGTQKPLYSVNSLRTDLLPSFVSPSGYSPPSISNLVASWDQVQFEAGFCDCGGAANRSYHPIQHMANYPPDVSVKRNTAMARLFLDDPLSAKMPLLIRVVQAGIDVSWDQINGQRWWDGSGYQPGHSGLDAFTAIMLDNQQLKDTVLARSNSGNHYEEDTMIYTSGVTGRVLFGGPIPSSDKTEKDPLEYIDGGVDYQGPGSSYQFCCISQPWKGVALLALMMPEMQTVLNNQQWSELRDYTDRWVDFGAWALPDPENRWPERHGVNADGGHRRSAIIDALWEQYRGSLSPASPPGSSYDGNPG